MNYQHVNPNYPMIVCPKCQTIQSAPDTTGGEWRAACVACAAKITPKNQDAARFVVTLAEPLSNLTPEQKREIEQDFGAVVLRFNRAKAGGREIVPALVVMQIPIAAETLAEWMQANNLTRAKAAFWLGASVRTLDGWLSGRHEPPDILGAALDGATWRMRHHEK